MVNYDGLYNKGYFAEKINESSNYFSSRKLYAEIVEDGIILPHKNYITPDTPSGTGGIVDSEGNFVKESYLTSDLKEIYAVNKNIPYKDDTVVYFGMLVNIWGHCLTENIKRLWFFLDGHYKKYFKNCRMVYLPMWYGIIPNFAKLLKCAGLDTNKLQAVTEPTKFKEIVVPDASFITAKGGGRQYTLEYVETIDKIREYGLKNFSPLNNKKFYFFHGRNQIGENYLANYFYDKGYEIVNPQQLPFEEQLNILANCEIFASNIGSIAHNTLFVKDHTKALLIPRTCDGVFNPHQQAINHLRALNVYYVDSAVSLFKKDFNGPYCYILSPNLYKHFGEDIPEETLLKNSLQFMAYTAYAKKEKLTVNDKELKYLEPILKTLLSTLKFVTI